MMKGWKEVEIGKLCKVGRGSSPRPISDAKYFNNGQIPWVKIADATASDKTIYKTKQYVNEYGASFSRLLKKGSLILATSGVSLGQTKFLGVDACIHDGWLYFNDFSKELDKGFFYYCLLQLSSYLHGQSYGAAIQNVNTSILRNVKINLPPIPIQCKIASILSAYDDLIENNLKRVKLLEEKAQLTYEEWFVRMKFPGHEHVVINKESGLPEGWEKKKFSNIASINPRTSIKKGTLAPYVPMSSVSESSMVIKSVEEKAVSGGMKFKNGDTIFARITPCLENGKTGFVQFMDNENCIATGSTEYIVMRETELCGRYFIYCTSRNKLFRENAIKSMVGSDGRQRVKPECFDKYLVNYSNSELRMKFEQESKPVFEAVHNLTEQNYRLKEARDILLPRLMTGMIDVDKIEVGENLTKIAEA